MKNQERHFLELHKLKSLGAYAIIVKNGHYAWSKDTIVFDNEKELKEFILSWFSRKSYNLPCDDKCPFATATKDEITALIEKDIYCDCLESTHPTFFNRLFEFYESFYACNIVIL